MNDRSVTMFEEDAFLRAIHATPAEATAKLAYADWLDERGRAEQAELVRWVAQVGWPPPKAAPDSRYFSGLARRLAGAWLDLFVGAVTVWDAVTLHALGRLQGQLATFALLNDNSEGDCEFDAHLYPRTGTTEETVALRCGVEPTHVEIEPFWSWEAETRHSLVRWLFRDLQRATGGRNLRFAHESREGQAGLAGVVLDSIRNVFLPTGGWWLYLPDEGGHTESQELVLDSADLVLRLSFRYFARL